MKKVKFILGVLFDFLSLGLTYALRNRNEVKALIECIDVERKEALKICNAVKNGTIKLENILDVFEEKQVTARLKRVQSFHGVLDSIKKKAEKYYKVGK